MKLLITGGCGFLGCNLAAHALSQGYDLVIFDNMSRYGAAQNLVWLQKQGKFSLIHGDIRNQCDISTIVKSFQPDYVFHLAGQVAMTTSIQNPRLDFEVNVIGTINLLESIREYVPAAAVIYSSTNKVYGDLEQFTYRETGMRYECIDRPNGFDETTPLDFRSPYGCSKGAADQYMLDYARIFGIKTIVFRHSSMYGGRQFSTYDQGWVGWFCQQALLAKSGKKKLFTISGSGKQVRDVLHADDMTRLYFAALIKIEEAKGQAFNIGGGLANSLSLLELFSLLEEITLVKMDNYKKLPARESDQLVFVADLSKANKLLDWTPQTHCLNGIREMVDWIDDIIFPSIK